MQDTDEVMDALDGLIEAIERNIERNRLILRRAKEIKRSRARGLGYREIASVESKPLIVELITENLGRLTAAGTRFRRAEAAALYAEGATMEQIAELFGVTRQRVSALLRGAPRRPRDAEPSASTAPERRADR
jgi:predicted transcriptional regulator